MAVGVWLVPVVLYLRYAREMMTGILSASSVIFRVRTRDDATYFAVWLSYTIRATSRIGGCQPQQRSSIVRYTK